MDSFIRVFCATLYGQDTKGNFSKYTKNEAIHLVLTIRIIQMMSGKCSKISSGSSSSIAPYCVIF